MNSTFWERINEKRREKQEREQGHGWVQTRTAPSWSGYLKRMQATELKEGVVVKDRKFGIMVYAVVYEKGELVVRALRFHDMRTTGRHGQDFNVETPCDNPIDADTFDSTRQAEEAAFRAGYFISMFNIEIQ